MKKKQCEYYQNFMMECPENNFIPWKDKCGYCKKKYNMEGKNG